MKFAITEEDHISLWVYWDEAFHTPLLNQS